MKKLLLLSTIAIGLATGTAQAGLVDCVSCSDYELPGNFDPGWVPAVIPSGTTIKVATSANQGLYLNHLADLTFEYLGKEASFANQFGFNSGVLYTSNTGTEDGFGGISNASNVAAGFLDFFFQHKDTSGTTVTNGQVNSPGDYLKSLGFYLESSPLDDKFASWLLFFNDEGGPDKDFDDMVVRLTATYVDGGDGTTPVPLPATLPLLGAGLAGLGVLKRMRSRGTRKG